MWARGAQRKELVKGGWCKGQQISKEKDIITGLANLKNLAKAHGNVRMEQVKDAQRNEAG